MDNAVKRNRKLRLLVTAKCPNNCPKCCNRRFDVESIPVVDRWDYDEISLTGGEPLMFPQPLAESLAQGIRVVCDARGFAAPKIFLYTALFDVTRLNYAVQHVFDGLTLTPHKAEDVGNFLILNRLLTKIHMADPHRPGCSLRLNLFPDMRSVLEGFMRDDPGWVGDLSLWDVRSKEWLDECPVPDGEDFRRLARLW